MSEPGQEGGQAITTWDPDGAGPLGLHVVVAGAFGTDAIKLIDPATNQMTNSGIGAEANVIAVTVLGGDLIAAGIFTAAGGVPASNIARYDGTSWTPLGQGISGPVLDLLVLPNGDLIAGGSFVMAGGSPADCVARWDGTTWSAMGTGLNQRVESLARLANGDVIAGGLFTMAGTATANRVAKWDGTSWSGLGGGMSSGLVRVLQELPNGDLIAGGSFQFAGGVPGSGYARWNGSGWSSLPLGAGVPLPNDLTLAPNGDLLVVGSIGTAYRFDGSNWSSFGSSFETGNGTFFPYLFAIEATPLGVVTVGQFQRVGGLDAAGIAVHNGLDWQPLVNGLLGPVTAVTRGTNRMLVGGPFKQVNGLPVNGIAAYDGSNWSALGSGVGGGPLGSFGQVRTIVEATNGDVYAGGTFVTAGGTAAAGIAHWDGNNWSPLGGGLVANTVSARVHDMHLLPNGDLLVVGLFASAVGGPQLDNLARWDGASWTAVGPGFPNAYLGAVAQLPNGDVVVGGAFSNAMGSSVEGVRIFDGTTWSALGGGVSTGQQNGNAFVTDLLVLPNGDLVVAGEFDFAGGNPATDVARWDGTNWHAYGSVVIEGSVEQLHRLPNGDLLAGGQFLIAGQFPNLIRWDGTSWSVVSDIASGAVVAIATDDAGQIYAGGRFSANGMRSSLVILGSSCPATATPAGAGCVGSGGANVLTATSLPWTGSSFTSEATGMPSNGLVLSVLGLGTLAVPMASILPQGQPGCDLLVTADLLDLYVPSAGVVATSAPIPNSVTLVGQVLYQQIVAIELSVQGNIAALTSSNRLDLTIGTL